MIIKSKRQLTLTYTSYPIRRSHELPNKKAMKTNLATYLMIGLLSDEARSSLVSPSESLIVPDVI